MGEPNGAHLDPDELDGWLEQTKDGIHPKSGHVRDCGLCRQLVSTAREQETRLRSLRSEGGSAPRPDCPAPENWARLAAGIIGHDESERLLDHVIQCEACGEELRFAAECFASDEQVAELPHATRRFPTRYFAIAASLAIAIAAGVSAWWIMRSSPADLTAGLLAQAYNARPPFEYRLPGTRPGRPAEQRGPAASVSDWPLPLLQAESQIQQRMALRSPGLQWVSFRSRADLLEGNYDRAIVLLRTLQAAKPNDAGILADLGRAYAIRASRQSDHRQDIDSAVEYLNRSLQIQPHNAEALFNLALLYTDAQDYFSAEDTWRRYLAIDPTGPWATEARRHLDDVQKKKLLIPPR